MKDNWVLYRSVAWFRGRGVSFGGVLAPPQMQADGVYSLELSPLGPKMDRTLGVFGSRSLDHVYLGPQIEVMQEPELTKLFVSVEQALKVGGHLLVHVKVGNHEPGKLEFYPKTVEGYVTTCGRWQKKGEWEKAGECLQVYKRVEGRRGILGVKSLPLGPRVCVVRYGAIGDGIIITPLLRKLKLDGYHVTLNINPYCKEVFKYNPNIDNLLIQERDAVPNMELGPYWEAWKPEYDRYINLCESLEGDLLQVEGRGGFFTHQAWRHKKCNVNYYDYTFKRAGYGPENYGQLGELFFTEAEERHAREWFKSLGEGKFIIQWALNGSSHHKVYPMMETVLDEWFKRHQNSLVITCGDYTAKLLEFEHPQLITKAGVWMLREALLATKYVDLVVGPETGVTNAAGCWETPKIVLLSHSSRENMTKYFRNDYSLEPDTVLAPCYPCHQLHYTLPSCVIGSIVDENTQQEIGKAPICCLAITPKRLLDQMEVVYQKWLTKGT